MSSAPASTPLSNTAGRGFWQAPEQYLLDAGRDGELLIARIRITITLALLLVPSANLLWAAHDERPQHLIGLALTACVFLASVVLWLYVRRDGGQPWIPLATSVFDVSVVTLAQLSFAYASDPHVVVNSKITFDMYFLALAGTCLRYDKRVALLAGVIALLQFSGTILFVTTYFPLNVPGVTSIYGRFQWSDQVSRVIVLVIATALNVYIVHGIQTQHTLSNADPLTGVFNRRFFDEHCQSELLRAARLDVPLSVAMIDVDHFKQFNDEFGHAAGDHALRVVSRALELAVRRRDLVARYGGEEFVVIFRDTAAPDAFARAERIRESVARQVLSHGASEPRPITVSAGVASYPADGTTLVELLAEADRRLFAAKRDGRNRVVGIRLVDESARLLG